MLVYSSFDSLRETDLLNEGSFLQGSLPLPTTRCRRLRYRPPMLSLSVDPAHAGWLHRGEEMEVNEDYEIWAKQNSLSMLSDVL